MGLPIPLAPRSIRWLGVAAVAAVIFYFSILQTVPAPPPDEGIASFWDKKLHFVAYAAFACALAYATATLRSSRTRRILLVLGVSLAYGIAIELLQAPLPDRYFSYADLLANAVGALLVVAWFAIETRVEYVPIVDRIGNRA